MWTKFGINKSHVFWIFLYCAVTVWISTGTASDIKPFDSAKVLKQTARYAINFIPGFEGNSSSTNNMAAGAIVDMMSHIRDPFKHGATASVLAGLYITALIALIVFAITGTIAFICSFSDCGNFFLGMKPEGSPKPFGGGPIFFKRRDYHNNWNELQPIFQSSLHDAHEKYDHQI